MSVTKTELVNEISEATSLSKAQVKLVFEALEKSVENALNNKESITIPNLCKIYLHKKPARKAREGRNPATGETMMLKAKPAETVVKVKAIKNLKEMI